MVSRYENPHEHSPGDTIDRLDPGMLELFARGLTRVVTVLAGAGGDAAATP